MSGGIADRRRRYKITGCHILHLYRSAIYIAEVRERALKPTSALFLRRQH